MLSRLIQHSRTMPPQKASMSPVFKGVRFKKPWLIFLPAVPDTCVLFLMGTPQWGCRVSGGPHNAADKSYRAWVLIKLFSMIVLCNTIISSRKDEWVKRAGALHFFSKCGICYFLGHSADFVQRIFGVLALKKVEISGKLYFIRE